MRTGGVMAPLIDGVWKSVYPMYPELLEWLNHNFSPIEKSVFAHYRGMKKIVDLVRRVERGELPKYCALSALRDYNEENGTHISYEEVRNLDSTYIFSEFGEWVAYVDSKDAADRILMGEYDEPHEAFEYAPADISWLIVWIPQDCVAVVYRSPRTAFKTVDDEGLGLAEGLSKGNHESYTLPPELEASMGCNNPEEIFQAEGERYAG